jgi:hypothetical protein
MNLRSPITTAPQPQNRQYAQSIARQKLAGIAASRAELISYKAAQMGNCRISLPLPGVRKGTPCLMRARQAAFKVQQNRRGELNESTTVYWYRSNLRHVAMRQLPDNANASSTGSNGNTGSAGTTGTARTNRRARAARTAGTSGEPRRHRTTGRYGTKGRHRRSRQVRSMPRRTASLYRSRQRKGEMCGQQLSSKAAS